MVLPSPQKFLHGFELPPILFRLSLLDATEGVDDGPAELQVGIELE
jgi:hypothetical protein